MNDQYEFDTFRNCTFTWNLQEDYGNWEIGAIYFYESITYFKTI